MSEAPAAGGRVPWPRFDVVETRWQGESKVRYAVIDHQSKAVRFGADPFNKTLAYDLAGQLHRQAAAANEPTVVLRLQEAIEVRQPPKVTVEKRSRKEVGQA